MIETYVKKIEAAINQKKRIARTRYIVAFVALAAFLAAYAFVTPAYTLGETTYCGHEAHQHTDACYETVLVCELEESPSAANEIAGTGGGNATSSSNNGNTSANAAADFGSSTNSGSSTAISGHTHSAACYTTEQHFVCTLEESQGHTHSDACYENALICTDESEGHEHTDACFETKLICKITESEGHAHSEACYESVSVLTCGLEEGEGASNGTSNPSDASTSGTTNSSDNTDNTSGASSSSSASSNNSSGSGTGGTDNSGAAEGHIHTDACYETRLICTLEEHNHTLSCYSNPSADVETASDWEATLPGEKDLTGIWADDLLLVAKSQIGYTESAANFQVLGDGSLEDGASDTPGTSSGLSDASTIKGYTRYGAWYGNPYGDWCAMFVSFCLHYAGIPTEAMPQDANCQHWIEVLSDEDLYDYYVPVSNGTTASNDASAGSNGAASVDVAAGSDMPANSGTSASDAFEPYPGDLVFFDWNADGTADHVGIVSEIVAGEGGSAVSIKTIEGNASNSVAEREYSISDSTIMGYAMLPVNPATAGMALSDGTGADRSTDTADITQPSYVLEDGAYYYAAKDDSLPRYYQWSSYSVAYEVHSFVLIPSSELEDGEWEPSPKEWTGKASANYVVAYCADDRTTTSPSESDLYSAYTIDNSRFTNDIQQRQIAAIIGNSYPFLSLEETRAVMKAAGINGAELLDEHELTTATQWAIWATIETVSHLEDNDLGCVNESNWNCTEENTVNPLERQTQLSDASKQRIIDVKNWLCSLIEPAELEVTDYTPEVTLNADGTSNITVAVALNRPIEPNEKAEFCMVAGSRSTEINRLPAGEQGFTVTLEGITEAELADARVNLTISGEHMQAYFFDSRHWQDMLSGSWEAYRDDLSFTLGLETIDVAVTKAWADQNTMAESVQVQLLANGTAYGDPVTLNAANNWHHAWKNLSRYSVTEINKDSAERIAIDYTVMELPMEGYYASDLAVTDYQGIENVPQWQEVNTFTGEGKYVFVSDMGALRAEYESNAPSGWCSDYFISFAPADLSSAALTENAVIWNAVEHESGYSLESSEYTGQYMRSYYIGDSPYPYFTFADGMLQQTDSNNNVEYFGGFYSNAAQRYVDAADKAMQFKLYKLIELELPTAELNYVITNRSVFAMGTTSASVTKIWTGNENGDEPEAYPESVQAQLLQLDVVDGEMKPYGYPVTLSAENDWSYTWNRLPATVNNGTENVTITYSVVEVDIPEDYVCAVEENDNGPYSFTLINAWRGSNDEHDTSLLSDEGDGGGDDDDEGDGGGDSDDGSDDGSDGDGGKKSIIARTGDSARPLIAFITSAVFALVAIAYARRRLSA